MNTRPEYPIYQVIRDGLEPLPYSVYWSPAPGRGWIPLNVALSLDEAERLVVLYREVAQGAA